MEEPVLKAQVLSQLLLMQSVIARLPDQRAVFNLVCRGLEDVPGISSVRFSDAPDCLPDKDVLVLPISEGKAFRGNLILSISDAAAFEPYRDHIVNFSTMLSHLLAERFIRNENEEYQARLEEMVMERTRELQKQIDENKRTSKELRRASEKWRTTFDAMLDPVAFLSPDGGVEQCNRAFAEFCKTDIRTMKGHKCFALIHHTSDHIEACPFVRARDSKKRETLELEIGDKVLFVVAEPVLAADSHVTGIVHILRDITDQKHDKAALEESMERYRMVAEVAHDIILTTDLDHRITFANKAVSDLMGGIDPVGLKSVISRRPKTAISRKN